MNLKRRQLLLTLGIILLCGRQVYAQKWVDNTFESFSKGSVDAGGQNIYVSKKGEIRTIRRFDLNSDGHIDLLFNSTHNDDAYIPATITSFSENGHIATREIPVQGSLASCISDLNRDSYPDIVFCPNPSGIQNPRRFVTITYGGKDGWPAYRTNGLLPVNDVKSVAVADLNKDGWPDIVTLNSEAWSPGQPAGNIIRIYWGRAQGFSLDHFDDLGIAGAEDMISGDFDADGFQDIVVTTGRPLLKIIWSTPYSAGTGKRFAPVTTEVKLPVTGIRCIAVAEIDDDKKPDLLLGGSDNTIRILKNKGRRTWDSPETILQAEASFIAPGDLDNDGSIDLVVSRFSLQKAAGGEMLGGKSIEDNKIRIFWGHKGSFSVTAASELDVPYTVAAVIGDLNHDKMPDIVCAVHQGQKTYATESAIYYNRGNRKFERSDKGIPGSGAYHASIIPAEKEKTTHVIISNSRAGNLNEEVPLQLYWGSAEGFSAENRFEIPFTSGYEATAADFNEDGYVDLLAINSMHSGIEGEWSRGINIFWGGSGGYQLEKDARTVLNEDYASTSNVADLNRDGYLDLVIGFFDRPDLKPTELVIYYGSGHGFDLKDRKAIPCTGRSSSPAIADYNRDGWLDIAVTSYEEGLFRIFWGGPTGFSEKQVQKLGLHSVIDLETADLNHDGFLDLIATSYKDKVNNHHDTGVFIYWGSSDGYKEWNAQWLPAATVLGPTVADFDSDGFLDLFLPSYHADISREQLPMYLYWGSPEGFSQGNRTVLIGESGGTDALAADFDRDGRLDLAVSAHTLDGFHSKGTAKIYYNDGNRFKGPGTKITYLPSPGAHWIWNYDMGHIYNRKWEESYTSAVFDVDSRRTRGVIRCEAEIPQGAQLVLYQKSASAGEDIGSCTWKEIQNGEFTLNAGARSFQYRISLISDNGDRYPVVKSVSIDIQ